MSESEQVRMLRSALDVARNDLIYIACELRPKRLREFAEKAIKDCGKALEATGGDPLCINS